MPGMKMAGSSPVILKNKVMDMKKIDELRIAFIGVSHWHVPLYLRAIQQEHLNLIAMSDPDLEKVKPLSEDFSCAYYTDARQLLDETGPEFVFAFAPHDQMPELAGELISRKIPFSIEKPLGISTEDVRDVKKAAEEAGVFVSIPFVWRYSDLIADFKQEIKPSEILHLAFKFIAGSTSRYEIPSPWMLEKKHAGGGCMTNLGVHFIDMAMYLTDSTGAEVLASSYHYASKYDIETYATSLVKLSSGATLLLETGYAYPVDEDVRDNRWNIVTKDGYYTLADNLFEKRVFGKKTERIPMSTDSDVYYPVYTLESLHQYINGEQPSAGLEEMMTVRKILDDMNERSKQ